MGCHNDMRPHKNREIWFFYTKVEEKFDFCLKIYPKPYFDLHQNDRRGYAKSPWKSFCVKLECFRVSGKTTLLGW